MRATPSAAFSVTAARDAGWSNSALSRAVRSGHLVRVRQGHYAGPGQADDPVLAAIAAAADCRGSVVSHRSAALMHGLALLNPPPGRPDVTVAPDGTGDERGALLHRATLWPEDVTDVGGVPVTSVARTLVDLGRTLPPAQTVVTVDAALHEHLTDRAGIDAVRARCGRWPGIKRLVTVMALADGRSESPLESYSRLVLRSLPLPGPDLQSSIYDPRRRFIARVDFYWEAFGVVGEADGRLKYTDNAVLMKEKRRQERLEDAGLVVVRWGWDDVRYHPERLRARLLAAFERGQRRDLAGDRRLWTACASAR